jgi:type IX secretion system PorP/SprF family membrane protein
MRRQIAYLCLKGLTLRTYIAALFSLLNAGIHAQDIHFSQFNGSLLNLCPGYTGLFDGDYRIGAIYRSQWQSVPVRYSTFSISGERRLRPEGFGNNMAGVGVFLNSDRAGDARYGTTQFYLSGSYIHLLKPDSSLILTFGASGGWCRVGFDYSKMTFDNQFDGGQFNNTLPTGETFGFFNRDFFDVNVGSVIRYIWEPRHSFTYGLGVHHLTSPVVSYQGSDLSKLDYKMANYLSYGRPLGGSTDLVAEALVSLQGKNYELIPHVSIRYIVNHEEWQSILGGVAFRARDAVVLRFGYEKKRLQSGISYDINISNFTPATNRRGGFEIFVNYIFKTELDFRARKRYCPVFM